MSEPNILAMGQNPLFKTINDVFEGKVDAMAIGFEHCLANGEEEFRGQFSIVAQLFDEGLNSMETILGIPSNAFSPNQFHSWAKTFNVGSIYEDVRSMVERRSDCPQPQFLHIHAEIRPNVQPSGRSFEFEVKGTLMAKDAFGRPIRAYPFFSHVYLLSHFAAPM